MTELVINGSQDSQHRRLPLEEQRGLVLGRGEMADLEVPWDLLISRRHAEISCRGTTLSVRHLETGKNPIYFHGRECREFELELGEEFQIGRTTFRLESSPQTSEPPGNFSDPQLEMLSSGSFQYANRWMEALSQLPATLANSSSDKEFARSVVRMILDTLPRVDTVAVFDLQMESGRPKQMEQLCWEGRVSDQSRFSYSKKMIKACFLRKESVVHIWGLDSMGGQDSANIYTNPGQFDWSFAVPITQSARSRWCLFMSGNLNCDNMPILRGREELHEELRFVELLAQFIGALRELRLLEARKEGLKPFFPQLLWDNIAGGGTDSVLKPRENAISVLFCQIEKPGVSPTSSADFLELSKTVDESFRVISESIFEQQGVMADFQGESAMAFWGWPVSAHDGPLPACRAALALMRAIRQNSVLQNARLTCGIAHGEGMAGRIGPDDQCKMGVFGHVVNLGARLTSMARQMRAGIFLDSNTAEIVKQYLPHSEGRCRKIGHFQPRGMDHATAVHELLLPEEEDPAISNHHLADFAQAVELILQGNWEQAKKVLHSLSSEDPCKHFLILMIALHNYSPPPRWDGVFSLLNK